MIYYLKVLSLGKMSPLSRLAWKISKTNHLKYMNYLNCRFHVNTSRYHFIYIYLHMSQNGIYNPSKSEGIVYICLVNDLQACSWSYLWDVHVVRRLLWNLNVLNSCAIYLANVVSITGVNASRESHLKKSTFYELHPFSISIAILSQFNYY